MKYENFSDTQRQAIDKFRRFCIDEQDRDVVLNGFKKSHEDAAEQVWARDVIRMAHGYFRALGFNSVESAKMIRFSAYNLFWIREDSK